ncbi:hypothetical protein CISG_02316 [Coccidioides immitis RMSCC 3703]|uniref:Uncharacterized protein n=1 Tax=Coccidioides immitis RMSCC 3703 TaxID=454286 RepID=A0A0J8R7R0_COCIT|nr:hypothetical protein CISG_02316 [Coccidioides immitis RMSCC 3703]
MAQEFTPDVGIDFALETPRVLHKLQSLTALARFEFEAGKGNEGTKILMVEWEDDDVTRSPVGSWHVSWDKKRTVLPADDRTNDHEQTVPPVITLTYEPPPNSAETVKKNGDSIQINPLPAIFSPELGATARTAGKKGVLHTIWAKKRLQVLDKEIREESQHNSEGVALAMALQEKEWIEANFGVVARPAMPALNVATNIGSVPLSPRTPLSPGGSKLSEKLKGLRLETSEKDLARRVTDEPDVAISSFNSFANTPVHFSPQQQQQQQPPPLAKAISLVPPASIQDQQSQLNTFASVSMHPIHNFKNGSFSGAADIDSGEGLFAKALSPRSPDIPRSPFSFSPEETLPYAMKASR